MKIEVWSDYVCPFCYIGKRRLEEALQQAGLTEKAVVQFKTYLLDRNAPVASEHSLQELVMTKFGMSAPEADRMMRSIEEQAKTVGLDYQMNKSKVANTLNAHRLTKFAATFGKDAQVAELLLHRYFVAGERIDTKEALVAVAQEVGLDVEQTEAMLRSDDFTKELEADVEEARAIGVKSVPFFVINQKYAVSGSQSTAAFIEAFEKVAQDESEKPLLQVVGEERSGGRCDDGSCTL